MHGVPEAINHRRDKWATDNQRLQRAVSRVERERERYVCSAAGVGSRSRSRVYYTEKRYPELEILIEQLFSSELRRTTIVN